MRDPSKIPDIGHGGRSVGPELTRLAREVSPGGAIVDVALFLGSTTAWLAEGAASSVMVHAFDTWDASLCSMREKARRVGVDLPDDFFPLFWRCVEPWRSAIVAHRGDARLATWRGQPIGMLVTDHSASRNFLVAILRVFGPHLAPRAPVVLMDHYWYELRSDPRYREQADYARSRPDLLRLESRVGPVAAIYRWVKT